MATSGSRGGAGRNGGGLTVDFSAPGRHGERRQVTALFYDIVDSTQLMTSMDAEEFRDLQRAVHVRAAAEIRAGGGYLEHVLGDGGFAYFGYPQASEDAARNAVASALAIVAHFRDEEVVGQARPRIRLRVGIATSVVVLAQPEEASLPDQEEIVGVAPTLAARIQAVAGPNDIAVSDTTFRLTSRAFDYQPLGQHMLKGFPAAERAWRPIAARTTRSRFLGTRDASLPYQSRTGEMALALDRWRSAAAGHGQFLVVHGEAGIGKSRFLYELQQAVGIGLADTHVVQFSEATQDLPLGPVLDWARLVEAKLSTVGTSSATMAGADPGREGVAVMCRALIALMSDPEADPPDQLPADELRARAIAMACRAIKATAVDNPQLVIFEDVHWADGMSKDLIYGLIDALHTTHLLACASARTQLFGEFADESNVSAIRLGRLDEHAVTEIVRAIWGDAPMPGGLPSFILARSDGIPLFAEEMARLLYDRHGVAEPSPAVWSDVLERDGIASLQDLLDARLAALGPLKGVAQVASVVGRDFDRDLLAALMMEARSTTDLDDAIARLTDLGIFQRRLLGHGRLLRFRHVMLRDAAYRSLLIRDRNRLHGTIARHLSRTAEPSAGAELDLANHLKRAGELAPAIEHMIGAARHAARTALSEASTILDHASDLLHRIDDVHTRRALRLRVASAHGPILAILEGAASPRTRSLYDDAVSLCEEMRPEDRVAWFQIYWGWWYTAPSVGVQHRRAKVILDTFTGSAADQEVRLQAFHCAWAAGYHVGDHASCGMAIKRGLALYDAETARTSRDLYGGHDSKVCGLGELAQTLWCIGKAVEARLAIASAVAWADEIDHIGSRCHALDMQCLVYFYLREHATLQSVATTMASLARQHAFPAVAEKARIYTAWSRAIHDANGAARRELREALAALQAIETEEDFPLYMGMIAETDIDAGLPAQALATLTEAILRANRSSNLVWLAELHRLQALANHHLGHDAVETHRLARQAIAIAAGQGARMLGLRALNAAVVMARPGPDRDALVSELRLAMRGVQDSVDLQEGQRLVEELS